MGKRGKPGDSNGKSQVYNIWLISVGKNQKRLNSTGKRGHWGSLGNFSLGVLNWTSSFQIHTLKNLCGQPGANATVIYLPGNLNDNATFTASLLAFSQCLVRSLIRWASIASLVLPRVFPAASQAM